MKNFRRILSVSALALAATGLVSADTIGPTTTYYGAQTGTVSPFNSTTCGPTPDANCVPLFPNSVGNHAYIAVQGFDPSLGTLNSVSLTFQGATYGDISIQNNTGQAMTAVGNFKLNMYLLGPQSTAPTGAAFDPTTDGANAAFVISPQLARIGGGLSHTTPVTVPSDGNTATNDTTNLYVTPATGGYDSTSDLNDATLVGLFDTNSTLYFPLFTAGSSSLSFVAQNNNYVLSSTSSQVAALTVSYDYTPNTTTTTPEPATFAMFGGALVGLGLLRRNRK